MSGPNRLIRVKVRHSRKHKGISTSKRAPPKPLGASPNQWSIPKKKKFRINEVIPNQLYGYAIAKSESSCAFAEHFQDSSRNSGASRTLQPTCWLSDESFLVPSSDRSRPIVESRSFRAFSSRSASSSLAFCHASISALRDDNSESFCCSRVFMQPSRFLDETCVCSSLLSSSRRLTFCVRLLIWDIILPCIDCRKSLKPNDNESYKVNKCQTKIPEWITNSNFT